MPIIEVNKLTFTYAGRVKPSIKDITLVIEDGEFIILTGPSGCGKTTLCRCFNGLIPHFYHGELKGEVFVAGLKVKEQPIHKLARYVGYVFQNPENQLFTLSVEKDVAFGLENLGLPREEIRKRVDLAMQITGVYGLRERAPYELSGGQQQRVAIATVLALQPKVMILDEPTSFLDPLGAKQIFKVIYRLNQVLGVTIILIEHRLDLAAKYASRVIVMDKGGITLDGEPHEVLASERAKLTGIGIPKATRLYQILKSDGVLLRSKFPPITPEEAANAIRSALNVD